MEEENSDLFPFKALLLQYLETPVKQSGSQREEDYISYLLEIYSDVDDITLHLFKTEMAKVQRCYINGCNKQKIASLLNMFASMIHPTQLYNVLLYLQRYNWTEFNYFFFAILIQHLPYPLRSRLCSTRLYLKIQMALRTKDLLVGGIDCFKAIHEHTRFDLAALSRSMQIAVSTGNNLACIAYNMVTFMLPLIKERFGVAEVIVLQEVFKDPHHLYQELVTVHMIRSMMAQKNQARALARLHSFGHAPDKQVLDAIFQSVCEIKRKTYVYTDADCTFVLSYLDDKKNLRMVKKYLQYFLSHLHEVANNLVINHLCAYHWLSFIDSLHMLSMRYLLTGDEETAEMGSHIYCTVYNVFFKNRIRTAYGLNRSEYKVGRSPFYRVLLKAQLFRFGKQPDIYEMLPPNTNRKCKPIIDVFFCIDHIIHFVCSEYMFMYFYKYFQMFRETILDDIIDCFMDMFIEKYYKKDIRGHINFIHWIKSNEMMKEEEYIWMRMVKCAVLSISERSLSDELNLLEFIQGVKEYWLLYYEREASKEFEKTIMTMAELVLLYARRVPNLNEKSINDVLACGETVIRSNMRSASYHTNLAYKQFIAAKAATNIDFFRTYLDNQLALIKSGIIHSSNLRRATEYRSIIHSLCTGVPRPHREEMITKTIETLLLFVRDDNPAKLSVTCHVLHEIMQDANHKSYTVKFEFQVLIFSLIMVGNENFTVKNAAYFLFETIVNRMIPSSCKGKNRSLEAILIDYPFLQNIAHHIAENRPIDMSTRIAILTLFNRPEQNCVPSFDDTIVTHILPICLRLFSSTWNESTPYLIELFVNIIPHHQINVCFEAVYEFIKHDDLIPLQLYSICFQILNLLLETYKQFLVDNYLTGYFNQWLQLTDKFLKLKKLKKTLKLQSLNIINIAEVKSSNSFSMHKLSVDMNNLDIQQSITLYKSLINNREVSEFTKIAATDFLLTRLTGEPNSIKIDFLDAATKAMLLIKNIKAAETTITKLLHISQRLKLHPPLLSFTNEELQQKLSGPKYACLYVKTLASAHSEPPKQIKLCLIRRFLMENDEDIAATLPDLLTVTKDKVAVSIVAIYVLMYTDCYEHPYVLKMVQTFLLKRPINLTFDILFNVICTKRFLYEYFECPKLLLKFVAEFADIINLKVACTTAVATQYCVVRNSFCKLLQSL